MLRFRTNHESGDILNEDEWRAMTIASVDEVSDFLGRFSVNDAAKLRRAAGWIAKHSARVCNYAHLYSANTRVAGDDLPELFHKSFPPERPHPLEHPHPYGWFAGFQPADSLATPKQTLLFSRSPHHHS